MIRIDLSRIAIAGFDIGAFTSMLAAGEIPKGLDEAIPLPTAINAVVALSPFADFSGRTFNERYQSISGPVLSVTSVNDADPLGVVTSPSVRKAPFEYMNSHDGYLLWLTNATHALISGSAMVAGEDPGVATEEPRGDGQGARQGGSRRSGRRSGSNGAGSSNGAKGDNGASNKMQENLSPSPTEKAMNVTLIQGVTTAFLDAYLRHDSTALEWLRQDASRWVGDRGELRRK